MKRLADFLLRAGAVGGLLTLVSVGVTPARADCFEVIGCTDSDHFDLEDLYELSCENLWHMRNRIYDENGYCFGSERGQEAFDNSDCWIKNQANVELSEIETYNVDQIVKAERAKRLPLSAARVSL